MEMDIEDEPPSMSVDEAVAEAHKFLAPVLGKDIPKDKPLTEQLAISQKISPDYDGRRSILKQAASLLLAIHDALATVAGIQNSSSEALTFDSSLYSAVIGLVDLLTVEGIYPALPKGVVSVSERRKKSLLYDKFPQQTPLPDDLDLSAYILGEVFDPIILGEEQGVQFLPRERFLSDVIIGNANLAHSPEQPANVKEIFDLKLYSIMKDLPTPTAYRLLNNAVKPSSPEWLKRPLGEQLTMLPAFRPDGVRSLIEFLAEMHPATPSSTSGNDSKPSQGPVLPIEALQQAAQLLIAAPKKEHIKLWLNNIAPQLLDLLDGKDGKEFSSAAAYIIGVGILGKRSIGAPGSCGWELFAEPILSTINPPASVVKSKKSTASKRKANGVTEVELVSQTELDIALRRLATLITSHPTTGLTARLVRPLLLPLWALANYSASPVASRSYRDTSMTLLQAYFKLSGSLPQLEMLAQNITWSGTSDLTFGAGSGGGIAIRTAPQASEELTGLFTTLHDINTRVGKFIDLLTSTAIDDAALSTLFLNMSRMWLLNSTDSKEESKSTLATEDADPLKMLATANVVQAMLEKFQDRLLRDPHQLMQLIQQVLQDLVDSKRSSEVRREHLKKPTMSSLSSIVDRDSVASSTENDSELSTLLTSQSDTLQVVNSLLYIILQDRNNFPADSLSKASLSTIQTLLRELSQSLPPDATNLQTSLTTTQSLINSILPPSTPSTTQPIPSSTAQQSSNLPSLSQIQTDLTSDLPPIRASALADLEHLIKDPSTPLDIPSTTVLLLNVVRTDIDSFVYLRAFRTLAILAMRDIGFTVRMACDAFQDVKEESGVDGRLRVGEALSAIVDAVTDPSTNADVVSRGNAMRTIAEVCLMVAGRRGRRSKEARERERAERLQKEKMKKAEKAWGGEVPALPDLDDEDDDAEMTEAQKDKMERELDEIVRIVKGWQDTGFEEDVRVRASAMSIVGHVLEKDAGMLDSKLIEDAVEMALSILAMEREDQKAILRRASVLVVMAPFKALDTAHENGKDLNINLGTEKWMDIERVLKWTTEMDDDDIMKGHAETVLESLENWRMKQLMGLREEGSDLAPRFGLEGKLRGLAVNPDSQERSAKRVIEEIE